MLRMFFYLLLISFSIVVQGATVSKDIGVNIEFIVPLTVGFEGGNGELDFGTHPNTDHEELLSTNVKLYAYGDPAYGISDFNFSFDSGVTNVKTKKIDLNGETNSSISTTITIGDNKEITGGGGAYVDIQGAITANGVTGIGTGLYTGSVTIYVSYN